ncbi:hypothetical protein Sme01_19420 [Sphaerisporangium melleum]|uniref:Phosphoribosyltransferase domain-containing protein n=1 Tax=Sphaerisporangium melleum TaxID=321316 RepID=A0A917VPX9_9ACTN|nr:phosphoribosyltransferase [Sphaerisporangium melleum]GGL02897.1 hypothetical protein GCM10007964_51220 [Sphaerisporangium melleum]GII69466.1 hypothetical protein Sme01_19420 [Sphaerisporangium melleum]
MPADDDLLIMGNAEAFTNRFLQLYHNVPPVRPGVCRICHSGPKDRLDTGEPYDICASCARTTAGFHGHSQYVVPISLAVKDSQLYDVVVRKRDPAGPSGRMDRLVFLAATVARFYRTHAECLAEAAGGPLTMVTTIPSARLERPIPAFHALPKVVQKVGAFDKFKKPILMTNDEFAPVLAERESHKDAFWVMGGRIDGHRVLLLDDLFVSGAHVQSAASALIRHGAAAVVALVIIRLLDPESNPHRKRIWAEARAEPFSFDRCCLRGPTDRHVQPNAH